MTDPIVPATPGYPARPEPYPGLGQPEPYPGFAQVGEPRKRRPIWPWIVGGVGLFVVLIIAAAVVAVVAFINAGSGPKQAVLDFDKAYKTLDCDLFESTVTVGFLEDNFGRPLDCEMWKGYAESLTVDGVYEYSVVIITARETGSTAEVTSVETDTSTDEPAVFNVTYYLVREGDHWLIDGFDDGT